MSRRQRGRLPAIVGGLPPHDHGAPVGGAW
eukprot:SAG22_NODE_10933_length_509_cov_1.004878_1_plen_29_part_10